jgi:hypothetical protein
MNIAVGSGEDLNAKVRAQTTARLCSPAQRYRRKKERHEENQQYSNTLCYLVERVRRVALGRSLSYVEVLQG